MGNFGLLALYVLGFIAIFYFLAIRPQQRQRKAHDALVSSIKRGDRVITVGGIHGKVKRTEESAVVLEIAKGVDITVSRRAIAEVVLDAAVEAPAEAVVPELEAPEEDSSEKA